MRAVLDSLLGEADRAVLNGRIADWMVEVAPTG